jgi:hypothetical protein
MINQIDRPTARLLAEEIAAALKPIAEKHGVSITNGGGSFTPSTFSMKLKVATKTEVGGVEVVNDNIR